MSGGKLHSRGGAADMHSMHTAPCPIMPKFPTERVVMMMAKDVGHMRGWCLIRINALPRLVECPSNQITAKGQLTVVN